MVKRRVLAVCFLAVLVCTAATTQIDLTTQVRGTLPHGNGGTDVTSPGSAGNVLRSTGSAWASAQLALTDLSGTTGVKQRVISFSYGDPAGSAITAGSTATDYNSDIPFACTISRYSIAVDSGTVTVKFWKVGSGTAIPTSGNSISTSGVGVSSGTAIQSTTLSDFMTTSVTAHDIMAMNVTAATAKFVTANLECDQ